RARGRASCGRPVAPQCATRAGRRWCVHHHPAAGEGCHRWLSLLAPFSDQLQESVLESALWPHLLDRNACVYECCHRVGAVSVAEFGTYGVALAVQRSSADFRAEYFDCAVRQVDTERRATIRGDELVDRTRGHQRTPMHDAHVSAGLFDLRQEMARYDHGTAGSGVL